jgi:hypothetical protein
MIESEQKDVDSFLGTVINPPREEMEIMLVHFRPMDTERRSALCGGRFIFV